MACLSKNLEGNFMGFVFDLCSMDFCLEKDYFFQFHKSQDVSYHPTNKRRLFAKVPNNFNLSSSKVNDTTDTFACRNGESLFYPTKKDDSKIISFDFNECSFKRFQYENLKSTRYTGLGVIYSLWRVSQGENFDEFFSCSKVNKENYSKKNMDELINYMKSYETFKELLCEGIDLYCLEEDEQLDLSYDFKVLKKSKVKMIKSPLQIIKFGPPGTGKSHSVIETIKSHSCQEKTSRNDANIITTVFHPDYSYGDFTAKLMPVTEKDKVTYQIHAGPLAKALAKAFFDPTLHVYLVVEEINRGNTAAIFGDVFQLLDRDDVGQSEYPITIQQLFYKAIEQEYLLLKSENKEQTASDGNGSKEDTESLKTEFAEKFKNHNLRLPCNLSIIATMNTSDESVFYMDSAFKRRWHFEYIDVDSDSKTYEKVVNNQKNKHPLHSQITAKIKIEGGECEWDKFRQALNAFIKEHSNSIRRIEDKLIGLWFIKAKNREISKAEVQNKLMHYLWDNVFARDKKPLLDILNKESIVTFGDFVGAYDEFIDKFCSSLASKGEPQNDESAAE